MNEAWRKKFRAVEIVLHHKWNQLKKRGGRTFIRKDNDIALLRIDYPAIGGDGNINDIFITQHYV